MAKADSLNLFFGSFPDNDFIDDLLTIKEYEEKEILDLIDHIIKWYPEEDIDKEWEVWSKSFKEEEIKKKKAIIRAFIFIFKEFAAEKVSEIELKEDFTKLDLPLSYLEYSLNKVKSSKEFTKKALRGNSPYENTLRNLDWRIDEREYNDGSKENIAVIEFVYANKGEKEVIQLDFNVKSLKHLILLLSKIEEKICQKK